MKSKKAWLSLLLFIALCLGLEMIAIYWTHQTVFSWYPLLKKPFWTPPAWIFGPVWTILYITIAIAGWLIYQAKASSRRSIAFFWYGSQLFFNFIWSFLFFFLKNPLLGLIDIVLLSLSIFCTLLYARFSTRTGSILLIPYLLWVIYAMTLNAAIWWLND